MRPPFPRVLVLALTFLGSGLATLPARSADADLNGTWKLVLPAQFLESGLMLIDVQDHGGQLQATVNDTPKDGNSFRNALPPIPLDRLSVVTFVPDDGTIDR